MEVAAALARAGKRVYAPFFAPDSRIDLLCEDDGWFHRLQVQSSVPRGDVIVFRTSSNTKNIIRDYLGDRPLRRLLARAPPGIPRTDRGHAQNVLPATPQTVSQQPAQRRPLGAGLPARDPAEIGVAAITIALVAGAYDVQAIERKWQREWAERGTYEVDNDDPRPPFYCLCMYPYPSGPAHQGHVRNSTFCDLLVRHRTMHGYAVISPIRSDSYGLPP